MTKREFLNAVIANQIDEAIIEKAKEELAVLDARNEKRKGTQSKAVLANVEVKRDIVNFLEGKDFTLAVDIAEGLGLGKEKVSSLCVGLVKEGILEVTDVKIPKVGKRKGYKLV